MNKDYMKRWILSGAVLLAAAACMKVETGGGSMPGLFEIKSPGTTFGPLAQELTYEVECDRSWAVKFDSGEWAVVGRRTEMSSTKSSLKVSLTTNQSDIQRVDTLLFTAAGLAGCILFFLIFYSTHEATSPNINIAWLHPLLLLLAVLPWFKKTRGAARLLHALNAVIVALLMLAWPWQPQVGNLAFFPLMTSLVVRSATNVLLGSQTTRGPTSL